MNTLGTEGTAVMGTTSVFFNFGPSFPLFLFAAIILIAVGIGAYVVVTTRARVEKRAAFLLGEIDAVTAKLNEAERIGKFGSFTWNFEHVTMSFWSEEMYVLSGLVPRKSVPSIDTLIAAIHEDDREGARVAWEDAQKKPGAFSFGYRTRAPNGEIRHVRIDGVATLRADKRPYSVQGVVHDVTREVEVDTAKSEFVSLASHQLKTPLTAVRWHCEGLLAGAAGPLMPDQTKYVLAIQEANQRMITMVNDLLNVSRIELNTFSQKPEEFDLRALAESVIAEQAPVAQEKRVSIQFSPSDVPHIVADKTMARMIFQNLISNAVKYTGSGGSVVCEMGTAGARQESVFVRVADTGIGIPKGEQGRVFEKLHRASNAEALVPDGTGLGLYVVKMIVEHAGGGITFESTEGKGTTFYVSLPLHWKNTEESTSSRGT
ncbi:MAG: PAS domain-containing sensor histidine kinase [Patescibacteria group bacterium]